MAGADAAALAFVLAPGRVPRGRRIYAIGDIHGCLVELRQLHAAIADDLVRRPVASAVLVHLGDYIDFGPDSAGVVALLAKGPPISGLRTINLMGDHERIALDALSGDGAAATDWLHSGGQAALESWGITDDVPRDAWRDRVPRAHVDFMHGLVLEHREGDYMFVHAGVRPGIPLDRQADDDMLGIRQRVSSPASRILGWLSCTVIRQVRRQPLSRTALVSILARAVAASFPARFSKTRRLLSCRCE